MIKDEGIIRPMKGKKDPRVDSDVLMVMTPADLNYLVKSTQARKWLQSSIAFYDLYQTKGGFNKSITFTGPFLGAPQSVIGLEKMIALGAKRIWVLGYCGSLQKTLCIGDMVIPTSALSEEGTSQHYPIGEKILATDEELNQMIEEALQKRGLYFERGKVWTTDAPYRETHEKVEKYQKKGILAVEMEMSALMTVAIYRTVKLAGLLVVSDELFDRKWNPGFSSPQLKNSSRLAGDLLINLVTSLRD